MTRVKKTHPKGKAARKGNTAYIGTVHEADEHMRSNPYLKYGYRVGHNSAADVLLSLFSAHNETINIYTHLVPMVMLIHWCWLEYTSPLARQRPLLMAYLLSCIFLFGASSLYHLWKCKSRTAHHRFLMLDFVGIVVLIATSFVAGLAYAFRCQPRTRILYMSLTVLVNVTLVVVALTPYDKIALNVRKAFYVVGIGWSVLPLSHYALINDLRNDEQARELVFRVMVLFIGYLSAFIIYHFHFPERYLGGHPVLDVLIHSHAIWHVLIALTAIWWYWSLERAAQWAVLPCAS